MRALADLAPEVRLAFNYENDYRAWLSGPDGVDLAHLVALARERAGERR